MTEEGKLDSEYVDTPANTLHTDAEADEERQEVLREGEADHQGVAVAANLQFSLAICINFPLPTISPSQFGTVSSVSSLRESRIRQ